MSTELARAIEAMREQNAVAQNTREDDCVFWEQNWKTKEWTVHYCTVNGAHRGGPMTPHRAGEYVWTNKDAEYARARHKKDRIPARVRRYFNAEKDLKTRLEWLEEARASVRRREEQVAEEQALMAENVPTKEDLRVVLELFKAEPEWIQKQEFKDWMRKKARD